MLRRHVTVGLAASIGTALVGFAVLPVYLRILGTEAYGLIGFSIGLQAIVQLLDLGFAPALSREVARRSGAGALADASRLLGTLTLLYWSVAAVIAALALALGPLLASLWLRPQNLAPATVGHAVMLLGLVIAARWPGAIYSAALSGAQRVSLAALLTAATAALGHLLAVAVLLLASPTIEALFATQAVVALAGTLATRAFAWRTVGRPARRQIDFALVRGLWSFSSAMFGISLLGLLFTQLDKLLLSRLLPLDEFGRYALATTVVGALYLLVSPFYNALYPKFSALIAAGRGADAVRLHELAERGLAALLLPAAGFLALQAAPLLTLWIGDRALAARVAPLLGLLAIGTALHGTMFVAYAMQLAAGRVRLALATSCVLLVVFLPLLFALTLRFGGLGAAAAWLLLHAMYVGLGTALTRRLVLRPLAPALRPPGIAIPAAVSVAFALLDVAAVQPLVGDRPAWRLAAGMVEALAAVAAIVVLSAPLRDYAARRLHLVRHEP